MRFLVGAVLTVLLVSPAFGQQSREEKLQPGPFPHLGRFGVEVSKVVNFENEIDLTYCSALLLEERVLTWLSRAYSVNGHVFVKRCIEFDPSVEQTLGSRHGGENEFWEEARLSADAVLITTRLRLPGDNSFSSAQFCSHFIAYWGFSADDRLIPTIYDVVSRTVAATRSLGQVNLETDNSRVLPPPAWNPSCSTARFDPSVAKLPMVSLSTGTRNR